MNKVLQSFFHKYQTFLVIYLALLLLATLILLRLNHGDFIIWWGTFRSSFWTAYFRFTNLLGEEYAFIAFGVFYLWKLPYRAIGVALTGIFVSLLTQLAKAYFAAPRPKIYLEEQLSQINLVDGWHAVSGYNSFPSGHTSAGFALAAFLCFYIPQSKILQGVLIVAAASVGVARVYSANHFLIDIVYGSGAGVIVGFLIAHYTEKMIPDAWKRFRWMRSGN